MGKTIGTSSNYLSTEDKQHCDTVFEIYSSQVSLVNELLQLIENRIYQYQNNRNPETDVQLFCLLDIDKAKEVLNVTLETHTQKFIIKLEGFFLTKYSLVFKSLIPEKGSIDLTPLNSYDKIIENIITQVGTDLLQAGKDQIKSRFLRSFYSERLPILKAERISIASFISIDEHSGKRVSLSYEYNSRLDNLINALNLFLNDSTELPKHIHSLVSDWKSTLDLASPHTVFPQVSFKFFKNQRLDVLFSNPVTARRFWNYYSLEIIEKVIKEND